MLESTMLAHAGLPGKAAVNQILPRSRNPREVLGAGSRAWFFFPFKLG